ncbi:hypothetical protein MOQ72_28440 [Saccharopolyspora sp. K220]|uniref:hypothetical protein n=1 Tax=Saccharopolyspora soli TaxID=2926618 RepID=UPI001F565AC7|nr:hypothetical protein [Saccharopolyspora soli]MCI2421374.1 hypothetical protein [Saccharopolyspora soli]
MTAVGDTVNASLQDFLGTDGYSIDDLRLDLTRFTGEHPYPQPRTRANRGRNPR